MNHLKMKTGHFSLVFEWYISLACFIYKENKFLYIKQSRLMVWQPSCLWTIRKPDTIWKPDNVDHSKSGHVRFSDPHCSPFSDPHRIHFKRKNRMALLINFFLIFAAINLFFLFLQLSIRGPRGRELRGALARRRHLGRLELDRTSRSQDNSWCTFMSHLVR